MGKVKKTAEQLKATVGHKISLISQKELVGFLR
jgi:hypothetical protein